MSAKEQLEQEHQEKSQDVNGTGMGEGAGLNDVSDQMLDEDQLLGADDKVKEEQDKSSEVPSKDDKGIEMERDFEADTFSVSEDSGEENEDDEDEKLESAMGDTGANGEAVDEKLWDKDEDENHDDEKQKYKEGPSVRDGDGSSRELRAKDTASADEPGEVDPAEINERSDKIESPANPNEEDAMEEMNLNKDDAFADATELELEESNQISDEDLETEEREVSDAMEEGDDEDSSAKGDDEEEKNCPIDENAMEVETNQDGGTSEMDHENMDHEEDASSNRLAASKDEFHPGTSDFVANHVQIPESNSQPINSMDPLESKNAVPESNWSSKSEGHNSRGLSSALPSGDASEMDILAPDSTDGGRLTHYPPKAQLPQGESSSMQKAQPNPYRNIGDALEEWKERANVSVDLQTGNIEVEEEIDDKDAKEYGYVSEFEKGTAQALGSATSEQIDRNINFGNVDRESPAKRSKELSEMEIERLNSEAHSLRSGPSAQKSTAENQMHLPGLENSPNEGPQDVHNLDNENPRSLSENLVSIRKSYLNEPIDQLKRLSVSDYDLGKAKDPAEFNIETKDDATAQWRRYELLTTRLSQELAEQLRLVMEPTLASKLQGDYKTGKRINMKKVIPYIASHYRKDKIWLRRTRPNKRDYQILIAVDDSRSMSESCCGNVAIEALVTVCRAMSILEMGSLAVASFGEKGNINLLHDFDQPFTGEIGTKMISSFTFRQENSITDEPVADLLKYLNNKLDTAVVKARHSSGQSQLQQLVLIIADGRFHEKDKLKRYVREMLSRRRMVAFLLLDSPQESIMDLMEASFEDGRIKFSKYLDSFPFPFYIVLKNIEALPRTLADLLRQWFELMQQSKE